MKVAIGCDHAGFPLKETVVKELKELGHEILDFGTNSCDAVDFPDFAASVAKAVAGGKAKKGILLCGSGVGVAITANKVKGARASVAHDVYAAEQGVQHEDMNILCMGARVIGYGVAPYLVRAFLAAEFEGKERQVRRLNKILQIEETNFK